MPNHVISATDVPAQWAGRAIRCQRLEMVPVECIARGYLAGLGLAAYNETGAVSGVPLPEGLVEASRLPEPIFTPTTKAAAGHDEPMTYAEVVDLVGAETAAELRRITLEVYQRGADLAAERGIIVADTKLEFGWAKDGALVLGGRGADPGLLALLARRSATRPAGRSTPSTSSTCGTGRRRSAGTAPRPGPRSRPTSWPCSPPATRSFTSGSPGKRPERHPARLRCRRGNDGDSGGARNRSA